MAFAEAAALAKAARLESLRSEAKRRDPDPEDNSEFLSRKGNIYV